MHTLEQKTAIKSDDDYLCCLIIMVLLSCTAVVRSCPIRVPRLFQSGGVKVCRSLPAGRGRQFLDRVCRWRYDPRHSLAAAPRLEGCDEMEIACSKRSGSPSSRSSTSAFRSPRGCGSSATAARKSSIRRRSSGTPTSAQVHYHFRISARERLSALLRRRGYQEVDTDIYSVDPLKFRRWRSGGPPSYR